MSLPSNEEWRPVHGYEGMYEVSISGRIRSLPGYRRRGGILKPAQNRGGHRYVYLHRNGSSKKAYVHRLVAQAFCYRPPGKHIVRHLDGNPINNWPMNLRWGTVSENSYDTVRHGNNWGANLTHCKQGHEFTADNTIPRPNGGRQCRACAYAANKRVRERNRATPGGCTRGDCQGSLFARGLCTKHYQRDRKAGLL